MSQLGEAYELAFLTDQWVWERQLRVSDADEAVAMAKQALETVVQDESPELACVTVLHGARKLGVWDWIDGQPVWTPYR